jgi:ammonium transporter Rh
MACPRRRTGHYERLSGLADSIIIHAFGTYFGLGLAMAFTREEHRNVAVTSDDTSDRFSMIGSMVLWLFWPSFCSAVVPAGQ